MSHTEFCHLEKNDLPLYPAIAQNDPHYHINEYREKIAFDLYGDEIRNYFKEHINKASVEEMIRKSLSG